MSRNKKRRHTSREGFTFAKLVAVLIGLGALFAIGSLLYKGMSTIKIEIDPNTLCQVDQNLRMLLQFS